MFGSYTSASRKAVLPVFEKRNNLYFYPTYYEGFECSKNVVYTGAVPNQQLSNFIPWIIKTLGKKKFFIVGSNYIYPREMAKVSQDPDREERRRMDRRRISRARPFRMGLDGQQDQGLGLRRGAVERGRQLRRCVLSRIQEPGPDPRQAADLRHRDLGDRDRGDGRRNMRSAATPRSRISRRSTPTSTRPSSSATAPSSRIRRR